MAAENRGTVGSLVAKFEDCKLSDPNRSKGALAVFKEGRGHQLASVFASWWRRCQREAEQRRVSHRRAASAPGHKVAKGISLSPVSPLPLPALLHSRPLGAQRAAYKEVPSPCRSGKENKKFAMERERNDDKKEKEPVVQHCAAPMRLSSRLPPPLPSAHPSPPPSIRSPSDFLLEASSNFLRQEPRRGEKVAEEEKSNPCSIPQVFLLCDDEDEEVDDLLEASYDAIEIMSAAVLYASKIQERNGPVDDLCHDDDRSADNEDPQDQQRDEICKERNELRAEVILRGYSLTACSALLEAANQRCEELLAEQANQKQVADDREQYDKMSKECNELRAEAILHRYRAAACSALQEDAEHRCEVLVAERDSLIAQEHLSKDALRTQEQLHRSEEIQRLSATCERLSTLLDAAECEFRQLSEEKDSLVEKVKMQENSLRNQESLYSASEAHCVSLQSQLEAVTAARDELIENDLKKLVDVKDIKDAQNWLSSLKKERDELKASLDWSFTRLHKLRDQYDGCKDKRRALEQQLVQERTLTARLQAQLDSRQ